MTEGKDVHRDAVRRRNGTVKRDDELERRTKELAVFRDAGVITEAELEEQKARIRWRLR